MTKKRFKYTFKGIEDTLESDEECKYTLCDKDGFQDLCEMLNELNDENEQLKFQNSNLMKEVAEYSRKAKELEKGERKTEKEKSCGTCKYFQLDGMFGMWCDLGNDWENVKYCSDWKGD